MKVSDILNEDREDYEDCIRATAKEIFHENYEDISGAINMNLEDVWDIMQDIAAKQQNVNFQIEQQILRYFIQTAEEETLYISKSKKVHARLNELADTINSGGDLMETATAIQNFVKILKIYVITESRWEESSDGQDARDEAAETCNEPSDEYARVGMKPSDFY